MRSLPTTSPPNNCAIALMSISLAPGRHMFDQPVGSGVTPWPLATQADQHHLAAGAGSEFVDPVASTDAAFHLGGFMRALAHEEAMRELRVGLFADGGEEEHHDPTTFLALI